MELKPCPWCKQELKKIRNVVEQVDNYWHEHRDGCPLGKMRFSEYQIDDWNTRVPDERIDDLEMMQKWGNRLIEERDKRIAELEAALRETLEWGESACNAHYFERCKAVIVRALAVGE